MFLCLVRRATVSLVAFGFLIWLPAAAKAQLLGGSAGAGVVVDAKGLLMTVRGDDPTGAQMRQRIEAARASLNKDVAKKSNLRKVSLNRLEKALEKHLADGRKPTDDMLRLAGLTRVQHVFLYPETGDIVIAGPAEGWVTDLTGRVLGMTTGRPIVELQDLVVALRAFPPGGRGARQIGCSIDATPEGLARMQAFLRSVGTQADPSNPNYTDQIVNGLRTSLGLQKVRIDGIPADTHFAQVMVEADYRMKLVGIGLEEGVLGVTSYLDMLKAARQTPALNVLRWWFTLNYRGISASAARDAFELRGQGVKVLSENELLNELGERVHTGAADTLTSEFAQQFTQHFPELSARYPVYAELRNVFDLALVAAVIRGQQLDEKVGWHMLCFGSPERFPVRRGPAPERVETVINHRVVDRTKILAVVSGGVSVEPAALARPEAFAPDPRGQLEYQRTSAQARSAERSTWWWD